MNLDIDAYLKRIQYTGDTRPNLQNLYALQESHLYQVPFENLDISRGQAIKLDVERFYEKVVLRNRGGFCYELNSLFAQLLRQLGYNLQLISARVMQESKNYGAEFDHLAIIVNLEGEKYLVDVGFGAFTLGPLKIALGEVQKDANGDFVLDRYGEHYQRVNKITAGTHTPEYIFQEKAQELSAFSEMCRFHQESPASPFTQKRLITKPLPKGRITLSGNVLTIKSGEKEQKIQLEDEVAFNQALWEHFKVKLS